MKCRKCIEQWRYQVPEQWNRGIWHLLILTVPKGHGLLGLNTATSTHDHLVNTTWTQPAAQYHLLTMQLYPTVYRTNIMQLQQILKCNNEKNLHRCDNYINYYTMVSVLNSKSIPAILHLNNKYKTIRQKIFLKLTIRQTKSKTWKCLYGYQKLIN